MAEPALAEIDLRELWDRFKAGEELGELAVEIALRLEEEWPGDPPDAVSSAVEELQDCARVGQVLELRRALRDLQYLARKQGVVLLLEGI